MPIIFYDDLDYRIDACFDAAGFILVLCSRAHSRAQAILERLSPETRIAGMPAR